MRGKVMSLLTAVSLPILAAAWGGDLKTEEESSTVTGPQRQSQTFTLREIWRAGGVDAPEELQFAGPFLVLTFSPEGQTYVLDQKLSTITELDGATGRFVRRFGRPGRGPGELSAAAAMDWDDKGRLWVAAAFDRRYSVFDSAGSLLKTTLRPAHATSRWVFPLAILDDGSLLDHQSVFPRLRFQRVDTLGEISDSFSVALPRMDLLSGIIRPGSALRDVLGLRPTLRWTYARDGRSVWATRSDSLTLIQWSLKGDTLQTVRHAHRTARFTRAQREAITKANRELGRQGEFVPILVQALHTLEDGRLLAHIVSTDPGMGSQFDVFGPDGRLLGTLHTSVTVDHRSEIASRGDTLLLPVLGEFDVPIILKAVLEER